MPFVQDFPVLENVIIKFQDFPGFPGPVRTLNEAKNANEDSPISLFEKDLYLLQLVLRTEMKKMVFYLNVFAIYHFYLLLQQLQQNSNMVLDKSPKFI